MKFGGRFLHLRAQLAVQQGAAADGVVAQWFWLRPGGSWSQADSGAVPLRPGGETSVYWLFVPFAHDGAGVSGLRFDPANAGVTVTIGWMAAAEVP